MQATINVNISTDQIWALLWQLPTAEKVKIARRIRLEVGAAEWEKWSNLLPDLPEISMEEIVAEVKEVRRLRFEKQSAN